MKHRLNKCRSKKLASLTSEHVYHFAKLCVLFNSFLGEYTNFADFLRVTPIQKNIGC